MSSPRKRRLVLPAMIFAVAMTFIDQTIVAIAVPELQKDLSLSSTGVQCVPKARADQVADAISHGAGRSSEAVPGHDVPEPAPAA